MVSLTPVCPLSNLSSICAAAKELFLKHKSDYAHLCFKILAVALWPKDKSKVLMRLPSPFMIQPLLSSPSSFPSMLLDPSIPHFSRRPEKPRCFGGYCLCKHGPLSQEFPPWLLVGELGLFLELKAVKPFPRTPGRAPIPLKFLLSVCLPHWAVSPCLVLNLHISSMLNVCTNSVHKFE